MKLSTVLAVSPLLTVVAAGGERGASERAMWWADYISEEALDESHWKTAINCKGNRAGLLGQPNRCTLAEFLLHIWVQSDSEHPYKNPETGETTMITKSDEKPNDEKTRKHFEKRGIIIGGNPANTVPLITATITSYNEKGEKGKPRNNFLGNINIDTLYPNVAEIQNLEPKQKFFKALELSGDIRKSTREALDAKMKDTPSGHPDFKAVQAADRWHGQAKLGARYDKELRYKDLVEYEVMKIAPQNKGQTIAQIFGHDLAIGTYVLDDDLSKLQGLKPSFDIIDMDATAEQTKTHFGNNKAQAMNALQAAKNQYYLQAAAADHNSAYQATEKNVHASCGI